MATLVSVAGPSAESIVAAARIVAGSAAGLEVGLVCPNSSETERMAELAMLERLLADLMPEMRVPVFVKLPPHRADHERQHVFQMLDACIQAGVAGVSLSGSRRVTEPGLAVGTGSLSGRETFADAHRIVSDVAQQAAGRLVIRVSGGVWTGDDALAMMRAGARTVEVYTAFIYQGWRTASSIKRRLVELLEDSGSASLPELLANR
jgi:dihydroorotate dehydrogenase